MSDEPVAGPFYTAFWVGDDMSGIPLVTQRAMRRDDYEAKRETERLEAERAERREGEVWLARHDGRERVGLAGVFAAAERYASADDYRAEREAERERFGELEPVRRSYLPESEYELERQLAAAEQAHRDLVAYRSRRDYPSALEAARARSDAR
jgi:hypothetical protein